MLTQHQPNGNQLTRKKINNLPTVSEGSMHLANFIDWLKSEVDKSSQAAMAKALSVSSQAVSKWMNGDVKTLNPKTIESVSVYRQESLSATYKWLDLPMPQNALDPVDLKRLEERQQKVEQQLGEVMKLLEAINARLHGGFMRPSPIALYIQDQLYKAGYDLRDREGYEQFTDMCSMALNGNAVAVQRILSQLMGAAPIERKDYSYISAALMPILGRNWNTHYLMEQVVRLDQDHGSP